MGFFRKINKLIVISAILGISLTAHGCKEKEFVPPNTQNAKMGDATNLVPVGTALYLTPMADKMAKVWSPEATLVGINGEALGIDGYNRSGQKGSKWIFTYKGKDPIPGYAIIFNGDSSVSWSEVSSLNPNAKPISEFKVDSSDAISEASKQGIKDGSFYSMELFNNEKGFKWVVGSTEKDSQKFDIKYVDAVK